jgi:hypothetical protein
MVTSHQELNVSNASKDDFTFTVLNGFYGVGFFKHPVRSWNRREDLVNEFERGALVDPAGYNQYRIVGLIVSFVEGSNAGNRNILDVGSRTDRRPSISVPEIRGGQNPLKQDSERIVFAGLEFVSDDGHFAVEVFSKDEGVDHSIGLEVESPFQILVGSIECFVVVRSYDVVPLNCAP